MNDTTGLLTARRFRSGAIVIDPSQRQVIVDGETARFGARAFDLLLVLLERRDRVVSKRELLDLVWPKLVVEENNLQVHVAALRKALGPQAIATIPGRGYQFALPIDRLEPAPGSLPVEVPATRAVSGNLPSPASPLVGRMFDIAAVESLVREHPVVSVIGAGGIGKTRLALAAAATAPGVFPDGRWWIELAPIVEAAHVVRTIGSVMGLRAVSGAADLGEGLAGLQALVVLDNCEHLVDDMGPLVESLAARAPGVRWLVTSQDSLKCSGEQIYRLAGLAVPKTADVETAAQYGAVALFAERAFAVDPRFRLDAGNLDAVIDICRQLDGIPLAIELAAARVPLLGVKGLAERLDQRFNVLSGGSRMKLRRHQTLRAALEWSYGLLTEDEQIVFRRLGVFAGGFTLELAQQLASDERIDAWRVLDLLGRLIDRSLVMAEGDPKPRYSLLETTRAFALEMLAACGESAAMMRRHAEVMRDLAVEIARFHWRTPGEASWQAAARELANLRTAMTWSATDTASKTLACELHAHIWPLFQRNALAYEFTNRMAALFPLPDDLPAALRARCEFALGRLGCLSGRTECWDAARSAVARYRDLGDVHRLADALIQVSMVAWTRRETETARAALQEAGALVTSSFPLYLRSRLANARGFRAEWDNDVAGLLASSWEQVELNRQSGNAFAEMIGLLNHANAQVKAGRLEVAISMFREVLERAREQQIPNLLAPALCSLSQALAMRGEEADVLALAREGYAKSRYAVDGMPALLAAALHYARHDDVRRCTVIATHVLAERPVAHLDPFQHELTQRLLDDCRSRLDSDEFEWLVERAKALSASQIAALAFERAALPVQGEQCVALGPS